MGSSWACLHGRIIWEIKKKKYRFLVPTGNLLSDRFQVGPRNLYCLKLPQEILMLTQVWEPLTWGWGVSNQGKALVEYWIWAESLRRWEGSVRDPWPWDLASHPSPRKRHIYCQEHSYRDIYLHYNSAILLIGISVRYVKADWYMRALFIITKTWR